MMVVNREALSLMLSVAGLQIWMGKNRRRQRYIFKPFYGSLVHFHRFTLVACVISWFIRSRMFLLMMPISDLHGLMSLQVGLLMKSGLWSFNVMNESLGAEASMRSASSSFSAIILSFKEIMSGNFGFVFLYVFVTFLSTSVTKRECLLVSRSRWVQSCNS